MHYALFFWSGCGLIFSQDFICLAEFIIVEMEGTFEYQDFDVTLYLYYSFLGLFSFLSAGLVFCDRRRYVYLLLTYADIYYCLFFLSYKILLLLFLEVFISLLETSDQPLVFLFYFRRHSIHKSFASRSLINVEAFNLLLSQTLDELHRNWMRKHLPYSF